MGLLTFNWGCRSILNNCWLSFRLFSFNFFWFSWSHFSKFWLFLRRFFNLWPWLLLLLGIFCFFLSIGFCWLRRSLFNFLNVFYFHNFFCFLDFFRLFCFLNLFCILNNRFLFIFSCTILFFLFIQNFFILIALIYFIFFSIPKLSFLPSFNFFFVLLRFLSGGIIPSKLKCSLYDLIEKCLRLASSRKLYFSLAVRDLWAPNFLLCGAERSPFLE